MNYKRRMIILFIFLISKVCHGQLFHNIPEHDISFCTHRMNFTNYFGCSSLATGNTGTVIVIRSVHQMQFELSQLQEDSVIFVVPPFIFASYNIINQMLSMPKYISGVVVMEPDYCTSEDPAVCPYQVPDLPFFTESNICDDKIYKAFSGTRCRYHEMFGYINYLTVQWPFPLIFLHRKGDTMQNIIDCYENYNVIKTKGQKCKMVINSFTPYRISGADCIESNNSFDHLIAEQIKRCVELSGYNIYLTYTKAKYYESVILIITKIDSASMFDTASAGTMELYPSISMLMYMAGLFHNATKKIKRRSEILLGFLDNDSVDNLGSWRMIYDLHLAKITRQKIYSNTIELMISLTDFSKLKSEKLYVFMNKCEDKYQKEFHMCQKFTKALRIAVKKYQMKLYFHRFDNSTITDIWMKNIDIPMIMIRSNVKSAANYKNSFLDRIPVKEYPHLKRMGELLAESIFTLVSSNPYEPVDLVYTKYSPTEIMECFYRISCPLLKEIIGPKERNFYKQNADPPIAQPFVNGYVNIKQGEYRNRLSYLILRMLIYYFHISFKEDENCSDLEFQFNFTMTVMDKKLCFHTNIEAIRDFNPTIYGQGSYMEEPYYPILYRGNIVIKQSVKLFISVDSDLQTTAMVFTTLISSLCFVGSIFLYRSINIIIPPEIF